MLKTIGIMLAIWCVVSALFVAFLWPWIAQQMNNSLRESSKDRHFW